MPLYCGIDLHARDSVICIIDETERIYLREKIPNRLEVFLSHLNTFTPKPSIVVESTINWYWLVDGLMDAGFEVTLAHTLGLSMITGAKVKTDKRDAFVLARLLRLGAVPKGYIYPKEQRPVRDLLRYRNSLVRRRAAEYGSLWKMLAQYGIVCPTPDFHRHLTEEQLAEHLDHPVLRKQGAMTIERIHAYTRQIKEIEDTLLATVKDRPEFNLLQTIPGVGTILALTIYYETGDIGRFAGPKQFSSYCRVVPGVAQSGGVSKRGRGSKQGNPHLKWAFCQAAVLATRFYQPVRKFRQKHLQRRKTKGNKLVSLGIVAHKMAVAAFYVLRDRVPFRGELMFQT